MTATKSLKKTMLALCAALVLTCGMSLPAYAAATSANVDLSAKGSISATLETNEGEHVEDGTLSLYQVADLKLVDGNMTYVYTTDFEGCEVSLDEVTNDTNAFLAGEIDTYVKDNGIEAISTSAISSEGTASFSDLSVGLYLVAQTGASTGYSLIDSFLVSVPLDVDDEWVYDVDASPKVEPATPSDNSNDGGNDGTGGGTDGNNGDDGSGTGSGTTGSGTTGTGSTGSGSSGTTPSGTTGSGTTGGTGSSGTSSPTSGTGSGSSTPSNTTASSTLPQTGQLNWPIPVLCVAGALFVVLGVVINRSARSRKNI